MGTWKKLSAPSKPKQYLQGWVEFYKLKFKVDERVLIPRPETELLIDEVLQFSKNHGPLTILDLGTGAGNIAISIAKNLRNAKIFATDISEDVLEVAKQNAKLNKVQNKIFFLKSDLLSDVHGSPNIIVTNLPYIPTQRIPYLDPSVKDFEPRVALDGGHDGFDLYRRLFAQIKQKNFKPKLIVGEIDYTHGELSMTEAQKYFPEARVEVKTDLENKQRILIVSF